jgi:hypothetical protein
VTALLAVLAVFMVVGIAQVALAGRLVDLIHGGPGRRGPRGRSLDVLVVRAAGVFVAVVAGVALGVLLLAGASPA